MAAPTAITTSQYRALAELRYCIRRFLNFSEEASRAVGIEPQQHQLLLALKALAPGVRPTVAAVAERLQIQHNSAVELAKRSILRGLLERRTGSADRREASLHITVRGERILRRLSLAHRDELRCEGPALLHALASLMGRNATRKRRR